VISDIALAKCNQPKIFLYFESFPKNKLATHTMALKKYKSILTSSKIAGAQVRYSWRELEPKKGVYNFTRIQNDLKYLTSIHKKLVVQLQYNSFMPRAINVPVYIVKDSQYHGGVAPQVDSAGGIKKNISEGWVARTWDPAVAIRLHLLFKALANKFDGKVYAVNLPETAIDVTVGKHAPLGFTPEKYFNAVINNMRVLKQSFSKSLVIQYVNFFPGEWLPWTDKHFMSRIFAYAKEYHIGLGGPDVAPYRKGQMQNSYKYFHRYKGKLTAVAIAVQSGDYLYTNPKTKQKYTTKDFVSFAVNYLGVDHLFWTVQEPFFSKKFIPAIKKNFCLSMFEQR
jgi:hypothetical protein